MVDTCNLSSFLCGLADHRAGGGSVLKLKKDKDVDLFVDKRGA